MSENVPLDADEERSAVIAGALKRLQPEEQEIVVQVYFLGRTFEEISRRSGRRVHRLYALHQRALRRLRRGLREYVRRRYGIRTRKPACPICQSPYCAEINSVILNRDRKDTWRPVLDEIRNMYGLDFRGPQRLIGHELYHLTIPRIITEDGGPQ